jgi:glycosyltransferase involved in cell wall biosynthesis
MTKTLSIIIPFWSKKEALVNVVQTASQLDPLEILVVANEGNEGLVEIENKFRCKVIIKDNKLKDDTARTLGARVAKGDVLLFLDGNNALPSIQLAEFIEPIFNGVVDVVLNNLDKNFKAKQLINPYMVWCQVLNEILDRTDLNMDSILSFPHALTKNVVNGIGLNSLANPILSQMKIVDQGWTISRGYITDLNPLNPTQPLQVKEQINYSDLLEALTEWLQKKGHRGGFTNGGKRLDILEQLKKSKKYPFYKKGWGMTSSIYKGKQLSVIIPAQNEELTIEEVIKEARKIEPMEIIVVVNGSDDKTASIATKLGATVIEYHERLGHNVGRAIGALEATGDIILFIDSDFPISASDLHCFANAVRDGIDIALNNLNELLPIRYPLHNVSAFKYALNLICKQGDLGIGALLAVPHAISRSCLESVGYQTLVCPSLTQVKAILHGYKVSCVHSVNVIQPNRMRPEQHLGSYTDGGTRAYIMGKLSKHKDFPYYQKEFDKLPPLIKGWGLHSSLYDGKQLSVIIPAQNHGKTIEKVIREARKIEPLEIIVVVSGSKDDTEKIAKRLGTTVIVYNDVLEPDSARAIGAFASAGDIIYFIDAALKGQTQAELRIMGDHLEAISYLIGQLKTNGGKP